MSTDSSAAFTEDYGLAMCPVSVTTNPAGRRLPAGPACGCPAMSPLPCSCFPSPSRRHKLSPCSDRPLSGAFPKQEPMQVPPSNDSRHLKQHTARRWVGAKPRAMEESITPCKKHFAEESLPETVLPRLSCLCKGAENTRRVLRAAAADGEAVSSLDEQGKPSLPGESTANASDHTPASPLAAQLFRIPLQSSAGSTGRGAGETWAGAGCGQGPRAAAYRRCFCWRR